MKKTDLLLSWALLGALALPSCQPESCELTGGSWKAVASEVSSDRFRPSMIAMTRAEILNTRYTFQPDGTVSQSDASELQAPKSGTWKWEENRTQIQLSFPGEQAESFTVKSCDGTSLVLTQRIPQDTTQAALLAIESVFQRDE